MANWFDQTKGWKKITSASHDGLINLFEKAIGEAKIIGVWDANIDKVDYYLNKTTKAIASCSYHKYPGGKIDIGFAFNEQIASSFPEHKLFEIVIHEVAHACTIGHHHDALWEYTCRRIGRKWGYNNYFSRTEQDAEINACMRQQRQAKAKYMVRCPACGAIWLYLRATRCVSHPDKFHCSCGWHGLESIVLK